MVSDLTERLRTYAADEPEWTSGHKVMTEAAEVIRSLTAALAEARDRALEEAAFVLECKAAYFSALPWQSGRHKEVQQRYRDAAAAIRALKEKP